MLSVVKLADVKSQPTAKLELPGNRRIGDTIRLHFRIERPNNGRTEELRVNGLYRVTAVGLDSAHGPVRQLLSVEAVDTPPTWRSVKNPAQQPSRLPPAVFPRTPV